MRKKKLFIGLLFILAVCFTVNFYCYSAKESYTGTISFDKSSYIGLYSTALVSVTDQNLNLRSEYRDTMRIRINSTSDPRGFLLMLIETGANTGVFSRDIKFSTYNTDSNRNTIKVSGNDNIFAYYRDERTADDKVNTIISAVSSFQFSEGKIQTSAVNDEGTGNMLEITIEDLDKNNPAIIDRIIVNAGSGNSYDDLKLILEETGVDTGKFECKLYFTEYETRGQLLHLSEIDKVNIKYLDETTPEGDSKEITKTISWTFQGTTLKLDKEAYFGYNSPAKILLTNMDLNKNSKKIEYVKIKANSNSSGDVRLELRETSADSGEFSGTLYFGKSSNNKNGIIKVKGEDSINILYIPEEDKSDFVECGAAWSPHNGEITLDSNEYKGSNVPVKITVTDWDVAENLKERDQTHVIARVMGSSGYKRVNLTETRINSGIFTGTLYINGSGSRRPSIQLNPGDKLEVVYTDEDTISGIDEDRTVYAEWTE